MMSKERRKRTRVPVTFDVSISIGGKKVSVQTLNISLTGILCTADDRFQKDGECLVIINLDTDIHITLQGKILRTEAQETAIAFSTMDEESFAHLKRLVQYNAVDADTIDEELRTPAFS
ncbi:MAG: PilZ domain-containing protein [Deltaproteobacteria bacterium]|nr:PilZ domain-containing protein [Deltaproteobacteria bacterium]